MTLYGWQAKKHLDESLYRWPGDDEQIKVRHSGCEDHSPRMYVLNKDGAYLFHCHNCNVSGYYRDRDIVSPIKGDEVPCSTLAPAVEWGTTDTTEWPSKARLWLDQYELLEGNTVFRYLPKADAIKLPIYNVAGDVGGYQFRNFSSVVKYTTTSKNKGVSYHSDPTIYSRIKTLIIVEDLLSAHKLNVAGMPAVALLGTNPKIPLIRGAEMDCVLWLDDDLAGHKGTSALIRELNPFYKTVSAVYMSEQPKEVRFSELANIKKAWFDV